MKNGYTKIFFSDPKSADLTSSKYKPSNNSEDHEEIKNVPHVFISFSCPLNATKRLETYVDFNILFADIRTVENLIVTFRSSRRSLSSKKYMVPTYFKKQIKSILPQT